MNYPQPCTILFDCSWEGSVNSSGFLLVDSAFQPVYANPEAVRILCYPDLAPFLHSADDLIASKIQTFMPCDFAGLQTSAIMHFQSGRRRYYCRAFVLENRGSGNIGERRIAMLLDRKRTLLPERLDGRDMDGNMRENPFSFNPELKYYYPGRMQNGILMSLHRLLREGCGIGVLLGKAGMGKTSFIQYFSAKLRCESKFLIFPGNFNSGAEMGKKVMSLLEIRHQGNDPDENLKCFNNWLQSEKGSQRPITLVCDEAQYLSQEALWALCRLSEIGRSSKRIQLILAGRQELLNLYNTLPPDISHHKGNTLYRLAPMDEADVSSYILHRLYIAGYSKPIFSSAAISAIGLFSRGIPLYVNMLCRHALSVAASLNLDLVDEKTIADSAYDLVLSSRPYGMEEQSGHPDPTMKRRESSQERRGLRLV
jgi:general secretion pathway protein A